MLAAIFPHVEVKLDIFQAVSFSEFPSTSSEDCGTSSHFGVRNNVSIEDGNSAVEGAHPCGQYKSLRELTYKEISYIRDIITSSMTCNIGNSCNKPDFIEEEHSYSTDGICSAPNDTALEMAVAALNFYSIFNGLESLGCTKFLSKSRLPSSIGLGAFGTKQVKLLTSSAISMLPELALHSESILRGHLEGFGLSWISIAGDGNCFFYNSSFSVKPVDVDTRCTFTHFEQYFKNWNNANKTISQLAALLRELVTEE